MALSDDEQRLLEQMEAALAADDPKLAHTLRGATTHTLQRRRLVLAAAGLVAGIIVLVIGLEFHPVVSILGFAVMLVAAVMGLTSWRRIEHAGPATHPSRPGTPSNTAFMDKLEERWRRQQDDGV